MVYVRRDEAGNVIALSTELPLDAAAAQWQPADARDPQVLAFMSGLAEEAFVEPATKATVIPVHVAQRGGVEQLCALGVDETDIALIRVIEDLIDTLIYRGLIRFTDLPIAAQTKLTERRSWRSSMRDTQLLDDDEHVI